jgi:hypothetical protein
LENPIQSVSARRSPASPNPTTHAAPIAPATIGFFDLDGDSIPNTMPLIGADSLMEPRSSRLRLTRRCLARLAWQLRHVSM